MSTLQVQELQELKEALAKAKEEISRLEADIVVERQRYHQLFEDAGDSIFIADFEGRKIIQANSHAARRLGYSDEELLTLSLDEIEVPLPQNASGALFQSTASGTFVYESLFQHKAGHLIPVEISMRVISVDGKSMIQNFVRSIAKRKEMEAEREELIADLESYAHTVAHDLKNPLSTIISYVALLKEIWGNISREDIQQHLQTIATTGEAAINIVDAMLLFASIRKQEKIKHHTLDMRAIVHDTQTRLSSLLKKHHAQLILPESWPAAVGYTPWVQEIWANYISNAAKYGGTPPRIELGSDMISPDTVHFWVRDNGMGIEASKQSSLFDQFNRLDAGYIEGTGLGLSIVKRITEKLGGSVTVKSTHGQGSTFGFTLPILKDD